MSINKFKNAWLSTDTSLTGTNQTCSLLNEGKSEFKNDVVIDTKLAINKAVDSTKTYKLDVGGDVNFTGTLYNNGTAFTSGVSLSGTNNWTGQNTFTTQALLDNSTKASTTAFTQSAINRLLYFNLTTLNIAFNSLQFPAITTGTQNFAIGDNALSKTTTGYYNVAVGNVALRDLTTGTENFCLGSLSLRALTSGSFNVAIGVNVLPNVIIGNGNIGIGRYVGGDVNGNENTYIGYFGGVQASTGSANTGVGAYCHYQLTSGSNNTALGFTAGGNASGSTPITGSNNTYVGYNARMSGGTAFNNSTCIGASSLITGSNQIILGTASEITYAMGGLSIPSGTVMTLLGNMSANALTITPTQLSFLSNVSAGKIASSLISDIANFLTTASASTLYQPIGSYLTSASLTGYLTSALASTTYLSQTSASTLYQPKGSYLTISSAISTYLSQTNASLLYQPIGDYVSLSLSETIEGTKTFSTPPVFSGALIYPGTIPGASIDQYDLAEVVSALLPPPPTIPTSNDYVDLVSVQTIAGIKTFSSPPVFSGDSISAASIPLTAIKNLNVNYYQKGTAQTIAQVFTFSTNPIFNADAIPTTAISGMSSYLTTASASSTYQPISSMSSYLTTASASSTYQTISGMSSYLTTASASSTYLNTTSAYTITGNRTYNGNLIMNGQFTANGLAITTATATNATTSGTSAVVYTFVVPQGMSQVISINVPIAIYWSGTTIAPPSATTYTTTLSSVSCTVLKNGVSVGTPTVSSNNTLPATKQTSCAGTFNILLYYTNVSASFNCVGTSVSGDTFTFQLSAGLSGSYNYVQYNTAQSNYAGVQASPITAAGTGFSTTSYTASNSFGISTNMLYVGTDLNAPTSANGKLQVISSASGINGDGASFKATTNTNNIINFLNSSSALRGSVGGGASAVTYNTTSDKRMKENIETMDSQLENIKSLKPCRFNWKQTGEADYGFIAQEVFTTYPHLNPIKDNDKFTDKLYPTKSDGSDYIFGLDYGKMTPYLWSAVQELILINERLNERVTALENQYCNK